METIKESENKRRYENALDRFIFAVVYGDSNADELRLELKRASDDYYQGKFPLACRSEKTK